MNFLKYLIFTIAFVGIGNAQNVNIFDQISTEDGLSQSDVNCIYQDDFGFMWFGTHDGLNRYDGYKFTLYKPNPNNSKSINSNLIYDIVGDQKGNLWIATTGSGLNYFDRETEEFTEFKHDKNNINTISSNHVTTIFIDKTNRLWIGTPVGINMIDLNLSEEERTVHHLSLNIDKLTASWDGNGILTFFEDSKNQIWAGTVDGLLKLSIDKNGELYFKSINSLFNLPNNQVRSIGEDVYGRLLIGAQNGLFILNKKGNANALVKISDIICIKIKTNNNLIWAGTNNGLFEFESVYKDEIPKLVNHFKYDPKNPEKSLSKNIVKSLFIDRTGIIWVGANGGGVNKLDLDRKHFKHIKKTIDVNSLSNNSIRSMFEDSYKNLWIGTEGGGLNFVPASDISGNYNSFLNFKKVLRPMVIEEVFLKNKRTLLFGSETFPSLYMLDISNPKNISNKNIIEIREISNSVFAINEDSSKNIWIGTYNGGVHRWVYNKESNDYKKDILLANATKTKSLSNNIIRNIIEDKNKNLWFGTGDGLCKLPFSERLKKNPDFEIYKNDPLNKESLSHNYILNIFEDSKGVIWVGTFGGGLNKMVLNNSGEVSFVRYGEKEGLPNNVIKGILEDDLGNLWLSTNNGLSRFNPSTETFKTFDVYDGLQSNEFGELACLKRKNGEMLFGGVNGFNSFFPSEIKENTANPETVITDFLIFNKSIAIGEENKGRILLPNSLNFTKEIHLNYSDNSFSFEFASLHFSAPKKNQYAYKLEGFNEDWVYTSSNKRFATYTNLQPGQYTFLVKASNNDGVWDETPSKIMITVIPPFWRTNWAYAFYSALILGMLFAFRRFTVIRTTKKHQLELEHFEKEKNEEVNRIKLEFFTNISHEFRTPLTLIKGPLEYLQKKGESLDSKKVQEQYNLMHKNTDYLLRLVNQLLDFRKLDRGKMNLILGEANLVAFLKEVGEPFQFLSFKKNINFQILSELKEINCWFDMDAIEKIINNLLSNAFKFTPNNSSIKVEIIDGKDFISPKREEIPNIENSVIIKVSDTGPGIPSHRIKHIFERFYVEVGSKRMKTSEGTGIGLSFTKNLVELHKGGIDVESEIDKGTTFYIWLPKNKEAYLNVEGVSFYEQEESKTFISQVNAESHAVGVLDEIVDQNLSRSRSKLPLLLVVDDNPDIRAFVKQGLGDKFEIYEAENGQKGLELANKLMPNIVITDILMPIMDGIEFCDKLKTAQETSHIPVVMLTAKTSNEWEIEGLKTGADAYIRKPFDMDVLELRLLNILKLREEFRKRFNRDITLIPNEVEVTSADDKFLNKAIEIVEKHMMNSDFSVELLVKEMSLSRSNLYLKIKELTGLSSSEFIRNIRLKRAVQLLEKSDLSVKEIMYMTGFNTASYFSKCFKKQFGVIPSKYIRDNDLEEESEYVEDD